MSEPITIPFRKGGFLRTTLVCAVGSVLAPLALWWVWNNPDVLTGPWPGVPVRIRIFWVLALIFLGLFSVLLPLGTLVGLWRCLSPQAALKLDDEGLISSSLGFIAWDEIERLEWVQHHPKLLGPHVVVLALNEDRILARWSGWSRGIANMNARNGAPRLAISMKDTAVDYEELKGMVDQFQPDLLRQG